MAEIGEQREDLVPGWRSVVETYIHVGHEYTEVTDKSDCKGHIKVNLEKSRIRAGCVQALLTRLQALRVGMSSCR